MPWSFEVSLDITVQVAMWFEGFAQVAYDILK
jgi:hypothetical protein